LPVITNSHSMGPDIIKNDLNGYIIPIRDANAIKDRIIDLRNKTSGQYAQMRLNARVAAENYAWNNYTARLKNSLLG
jgi:alpha-maltose-1-phosphate synthase